MDSLKHFSDILPLMRKKIPRAPGVYLFSDVDDEILYVGKSVNLRQRISSYFASDVARLEYRTREMIFRIADIDYYETETELLALLLEDTLIKKYQPRYNVKQQQYLGYQYILLTGDIYPTCRMISHVDDRGNGRLFGPFKSRFFVKDLLWIIRRFLRLRSCEDPEPIRYCLGYAFDYCSGPCLESISPDEYALIVNKVVDFLQGEGDYVIGILTAAMEERSRELNFEKAEELKARIEFCERFCERQRFLYRFKEDELTICENGDSGVTYAFEKGRLKSVGGTTPAARSCQEILLQEMKNADGDPRFILDRGNIVYSWLQSEKNDCKYMFSGGAS